MKKLYAPALGLAAIAAVVAVSISSDGNAVDGAENQSVGAPDAAAVARSRKTVHMLDNIYKQTIILITDKYVHDEDDFPAGSAAVALFAAISKSGSHHVRLIDATGEPYEPENVARDDFEREGVRQLKAGADSYEQVVRAAGEHQLRMLTPVPVVREKCVMCHAHYADAKPGEPIGAISYMLPIE